MPLDALIMNLENNHYQLLSFRETLESAFISYNVLVFNIPYGVINV